MMTSLEISINNSQIYHDFGDIAIASEINRESIIFCDFIPNREKLHKAI